MNKENLKVGQWVLYYPTFGPPEVGRIKSIQSIPGTNRDSVSVVYNCNGVWNDYQNYTGASTNLRDLKPLPTFLFDPKLIAEVENSDG